MYVCSGKCKKTKTTRKKKFCFELNGSLQKTKNTLVVETKKEQSYCIMLRLNYSRNSCNTVQYTFFMVELP